MRKLQADELTAYQDRVISVVMGDRRRPWFSICAVTDACKVLAIEGYHEDPNYKLLQGLHCCDYSAMSEDMRAMIPGAIRSVLRPKTRTSWLRSFSAYLLNKEA